MTTKPVMVIWSREEEFFFDTFRPAAVVKIRSGLDEAGSMVFWDYHVYFAGHRGCDNFYEIPHHREAVYGEWRIDPGIHPFAVGPWRAPAANTNVYARDLSLPPKGGGEPAIVCLGGVLATAVHDATGAKVLQLPMTRDRVKAALKNK
jgi:hypothetical protein